MSLKCLIIDDEPIAQNIIERYIAPIDNLELVGKCNNAVEAINIIQSGEIDLIFLDIEMPRLDGFSLLKSLKNPPKVIVTTAYREYAMEGFELDVMDYLLKPIPYERLLKAVNKVLKIHSLEEMVHDTEQDDKSHKEFIYLKADKKMVQINFEDISYIEGLSNYVRIFITGKPIITYQKLSHLQDILPADRFLRIHKSYIVSLSKITAYTSTGIELDGNNELPLGGSYKKQVLERLSKYER